MTKGPRQPLASERQRLDALRHALVPVQNSLSMPMLIALLMVAIEPGLSVNELSERLRVPQQSASRYASILMGRYEDLGSGGFQTPLVAQEIHPEDPRKRALFLTEAGWKLVDALLSKPRV